MAVTLTRTSRRQGISFFIATFTCVFSGSYPAGGEVVDFATLVGYTNKQPFLVEICGKAGYVYQYDFQNKKIMVRVNTGAGANLGLPEHTAAAYNAGVTGDTVTIVVFIPKMA